MDMWEEHKKHILEQQKTKIEAAFNVDLLEFQYSLAGDGYLLQEVDEMSKEDLIKIFKQRYVDKIPVEIHKKFLRTRDLGLLSKK